MKCFLYLIFAISSTWMMAEVSAGKRIVGGGAGQPKEFPYMAAIWKTTSLGRYFCGGTVIERQWILTAGHCVEDATVFSIQLGSISLGVTDENRINITASTYAIHPDFDAETFRNNIGLINLDEPLVYNDYVNFLPLTTEVLTEDTMLTTIGWGQIDDQHSGPLDGLQKVNVVSLLNDHCRTIYGTQIQDNMVCVEGLYNEGPCIGDIGGPLILHMGATDAHVGIASFLSGNGCESVDPSGYERTFPHLDWIKNITNMA